MLFRSLGRDMRCAPDAKLRVYRTRNAGRSWEPLARGLPQQNAYETVLRDAMTNDTLDPARLYFGTRSGKLFGSSTEGNSWQLILGGLPPITCVKTAVLGEPQSAPRSKAAKPAKRAASKKAGRAARRRK